MEFNLLEDGGVEEEEGFPVVDAIVDTHRFALRAEANRDISVAFPPKLVGHTSGFVQAVLGHVLTRGKIRGLSKEVLRGPRVEGLVIDVRGRV